MRRISLALVVLMMVFQASAISHAEAVLPDPIPPPEDEPSLSEGMAVFSPDNVVLQAAGNGSYLWFTVSPGGDVSSATVTVSGLNPETSYYVYVDSFAGGPALAETDTAGTLTLVQDVHEPHIVFVQAQPSTVTLGASGWSRAGVGTWDPVNRVGSLTANLNELIEIIDYDITLEGNGFRVSAGGPCVYATGRNNVIVRNIKLYTTSFTALHLYHCDYFVLDRVQTTGYGAIYLQGSSYGQITDCTMNIPTATGVELGYYYWWGNNGSHYNTFTRCTFTCRHGINASLGRGNAVVDSAFQCGVYGIQDIQGNNWTISGNTFSSCGTGIWLRGAQNYPTTGVVVSGNTFSSCGTGVNVYTWTNNCQVRDNTVTGSPYYGIYLNYASRCIIERNVVCSSQTGLYLYNSGTMDNTIRLNTFENNTYGLHHASAGRNYIYNNNFLGNTQQVRSTSTGGQTFSQPAPTGGNYWSNWTSPDSNGDGFVDNPYSLPSGSVDLLPWTVPDGWEPPDTAITSGPGTWHNSVEATFTYTGSDLSTPVDELTYSWRMDGSAWSADSGATSVTIAALGEGTHLFEVRARDTAGVYDPTPDTWQFSVDTVPPVMSYTYSSPSNAAGWWNSPVTVTFTAEDAGGSGVVSLTPPAEVVVEGIWTITGEASDLAGNTASVGAPVSLDLTPPAVDAALSATQGENGWYVSPVTVIMVALDDGSGLQSIEYRLDGCGWVDYAGPFTVTTDGVHTLEYQATDTAGNTCSAETLTFDMDTARPVVSSPGALPNPVAVGLPVSLSATASDALPSSSLRSAEYSLDGGSNWSPMGASDGAFDEESEELVALIPAFDAPAVVEVLIRAKDAAGHHSLPVSVVIAVYDPTAGFVTGGGWIDSPVGAYTPDPSAGGRANFGFVAKYKRGTTVPDGNTQFMLISARFKFQSVAYEWLVISGGRAQYKGSGTINGHGDYAFLLTGIDGDLTGSKSDAMRLKVWDKDTGEVIYDNRLGESDLGHDATALGGGSVVIHK